MALVLRAVVAVAGVAADGNILAGVAAGRSVDVQLES